jgi:ActR/RegA family two-component response regulator
MLELKDYAPDLRKLVIAALAAGTVSWLTGSSSLIIVFLTGIAAASSSIYDIYRLWNLNRTITILILEDTEEDRKQIKNILTKHFKVFATEYSETALIEARKNKNLKFGIIDEVLFENDQQSRQRFQGIDAIKRLGKDRPDMRFIILTNQIIDQAKVNNDTISTFAERFDKYLANENVVDVIHKQQYKDDRGNYRGSIYNRIIDKIKLLIKAGNLR